MNAEGGIDNLFGNGVLGHRSFSLSLAKAQDAKNATALSGWVDSTGHPTDDFGNEPTL